MNRLHTILACLACSAALATAQVCVPAFSPPTPEQGPLGAGGTVRAVTAWDPDGPGPQQEWLIVGGEGLMPEFTAVDIAAWDGSNWRSLNATFSPGVVIRALTTYQGRLIVGGDFTTVNGQPASSLAVYDGQTWTGLGTGVSVEDGSQATVAAFTLYNGNLYIGGTFNRVGNQPAASVATWNGTQLQPVPAPGGPTIARVRAMVPYGSGVAVGAAAGSGLDAMGLGATTLGLWNGTSWQTLGPTPATGAVNDLEVDGATLLVAGAAPTGASGLMRLNANNTWLSAIAANFGQVAALERVAGGR